MGLFSAKPKLERGDPHFLIQQVAKLENQKSLAWIAKNEENAVLREVAIQKLDALKWVKLLKKIAHKKDEDFQVQGAAFSKLEEYVHRITDRGKLEEISKNGLGIGERDVFLREEADKKLAELNMKTKPAPKGFMMQCPHCKESFQPPHLDGNSPMKCTHCGHTWKWVTED